MKLRVFLLGLALLPLLAAGESLFVAFPRDALGANDRQRVAAFLRERAGERGGGKFMVCRNTETHAVWLVDSLWVEHLDGRDKVATGVAAVKAALPADAGVVVELTDDAAGWMEKLHLVPLGDETPETAERW